MFLHTHLFNNTTKVNRAKRGALRLILGGARPMQVSPSETPGKRTTYHSTDSRSQHEICIIMGILYG